MVHSDQMATTNVQYTAVQFWIRQNSLYMYMEYLWNKITAYRPICAKSKSLWKLESCKIGEFAIDEFPNIPSPNFRNELDGAAKIEI